MIKQTKNVFVKPKYRKSRKISCFLRQKRLYRYKSTILNCKYVFLKEYIQNFKLKISIRIRPNNIFCTLTKILGNKILLNVSSGTYKLRTSKKNLKHNIKSILESFFYAIQKFLKNKKNILIEILSSIKIRKRIIKFLNKTLKKKNLILYTNEKKCFNGCRPAKKRRKKGKRLRIFK